MIRLVQLCSWHMLPASLVSPEFAESYFYYLVSVCSKRIFCLFAFLQSFHRCIKEGLDDCFEVPTCCG